MIEAPKIEQRSVSELIPYAANSRTHSDAQVAQIAASIKEFGWTNPILIDDDNTIIAGHGRLLAARKLGMEEVPAIILDHLTKAQQRALVIADNQLALNAGWDMDMLKAEIEDLKLDDFNIALLGFDASQLADMFDDDSKTLSEENPYTAKINTPIYEPKGDKPLIKDLYDDKKTSDLIAEIKASKLDDKEKQFLILAAYRHVVFDYAKIANFYAHSSVESQELMENSALVIIDFEKAILNGFVKLTDEINRMFRPDEQDEDE
jgi:hypothetical protein